MFEIYFFIGAIIVLNLYTHHAINKDGAYFLDEEKPKYISMVWFIPLIGALIVLQKLHADKNFYIGVTAVYFLLKFGLYYLMFGIF
jgi:NADH:ubiquinone oxidoreductase subunit 6 (subunit J)